MPEGNPPIVTETIPEKPFVPVIETVTGALVVPACVLTDEGDSEMEKSGGGAVMVAGSRSHGMAQVPARALHCKRNRAG